jgi:putative ATP-dependent endonuclease of OLD family
MYLAKLTVTNFRRLEHADLTFQKGLNVIVGENNSGKTAIVDAIRAVLNNYRIEIDDLRWVSEQRVSSCSIEATFDGLEPATDEPAFVDALVPGNTDGKYGARFLVAASAGDGEDITRSAEVGTGVRRTYYDLIERVRVDYLKPLRDPNTGSGGLRAGRNSRVAELLKKTTTKDEQDSLTAIGKTANDNLKATPSVSRIEDILRDNLKSLTRGGSYAEHADINFVKPEFGRLAAQLEAYADGLGIDMAGLGTGNLFYISAVLGELAKGNETQKRYRALIIEEPEAHLHPHLQILLLRFLQEHTASNQSAQVFVTTHSPTFASEVAVNSLLPISHNFIAGAGDGQGDQRITRLQPVKINPSSDAAVRVRQYLDATRSELFFAKRVLLVEGDAERFALKSLARRHNSSYDFEARGVSLLSAAGLNFAVFIPFLGKDGMNIRTAIVTDGDAPPQQFGTEELAKSAFVMKLIEIAADHPSITIFPSQVTFEYDLAAEAGNKTATLDAISRVRPRKGPDFAKEHGDKDGAAFAALFLKTFFVDDETSKPQFASEFALIADDASRHISVPSYLGNAFDFVFGD